MVRVAGPKAVLLQGTRPEAHRLHSTRPGRHSGTVWLGAWQLWWYVVSLPLALGLNSTRPAARGGGHVGLCIRNRDQRTRLLHRRRLATGLPLLLPRTTRTRTAAHSHAQRCQR